MPGNEEVDGDQPIQVIANSTGRNDKTHSTLDSSSSSTTSGYGDSGSSSSSRPTFGTMSWNTIFVGGISPDTTESELLSVFSSYGNVSGTKIVSDRRGVSKGYGFVTFETEEEVRSLCEGMMNNELEPLILQDHRLSIAPAVSEDSEINDDEASQITASSRGRRSCNFSILDSSSSSTSATSGYGGSGSSCCSKPMFGALVPNRIFVGGIPPETTESELLSIFSSYGNVRATKIISDPSSVSKSYGFVTYETEQEARSLWEGVLSMELEPIILREHRLNIAPSASESENSEFKGVQSQLGQIVASSPDKRDENTSILDSLNSSTSCIRRYGEAPPTVGYGETSTASGLSSTGVPMFGTMIPNRIFVGGVPPDTTESELFTIFSLYGNVRATKIIADRAGVSKGYGFVTYETEQEARSVIEGMLNRELDPIILRERRLNIAPAVKKQLSGSEIGYPSAPPSPPPYTAASYYMSQGNPYQYYYQSTPMHDQYYQPDISPFGSQPYYGSTTASIPSTSNGLYCVPEQQYQYSPYSVQPQTVPCGPPPPTIFTRCPQYPINAPASLGFYHAPDTQTLFPVPPLVEPQAFFPSTHVELQKLHPPPPQEYLFAWSASHTPPSNPYYESFDAPPPCPYYSSTSAY